MKDEYPNAHIATQAQAENRRILCAGTNCARIALVWLNDDEQERYHQGVRRFVVMRHNEVQVI